MGSLTIAVLTLAVYLLVSTAEAHLDRKYAKYHQGVLGFLVFSILSVVFLFTTMLLSPSFGLSFLFFTLLMVWWIIRYDLNAQVLSETLSLKSLLRLLRAELASQLSYFRFKSIVTKDFAKLLLPSVAFSAMVLFMAPDVILFVIVVVTNLLYAAVALYVAGVKGDRRNEQRSKVKEQEFFAQETGLFIPESWGDKYL